ncbi:EI24 domain-containing protein [Candidatus Dojkabacteria bacterium]|nr:EI24 domain-containing protein [Candidatus Dojkabacteria bacterium]
MSLIVEKSKEVIDSFKVVFVAIVYLLARPRLYVFIIIPYLINTIIFILLFGLVFAFFNQQINSLTSLLEFSGFWVEVINKTLKVLGTILATVFTSFLLISIALIIQSPFNSIITESILKENNIEKKNDKAGIKFVIADILRALEFEIVKLLIIAFVFIITFALNFIPVIGSFLYLAINTLNIFFLNLLDLLDPSYNYVGFKVFKELKLTFKNISNYLGFGILAYTVWGIPVINFLLMPILYSSATIAFLKTYSRDTFSKS